jgi:hypothetical protein
MNENTLIGFVVGALAAAFGGVIALRYIQRHPIGGGEPLQGTSYSPTNWLTPQTPPRVDMDAAPVVQNTPITEAAYNQQPTDHSPAFGRNANGVNDAEAVVIPW